MLKSFEINSLLLALIIISQLKIIKCNKRHSISGWKSVGSKQRGNYNCDKFKRMLTNMKGSRAEVVYSVATGNASTVILLDAEICYKKGQPILNGMNMNVPHGTIYGLLGSSGCGKTTVLSCILGQKKLDRGEIRIYNSIPGSKECGVPGRNVGYMPQDISLCKEFSIEETFCYFGGLAGIKKELITSRVKFMVKLMDLPEGNRRIGTLSGGQQRRVSLAAALIHDPKLLILDEPTVGVDPILRQRIWQHLRLLVGINQTTVIITSHYIEECRQADVIGVMRDGRMLAEKPPTQLFYEHFCDNLEAIVLNLCRRDSSSSTGSTITSQTQTVIKNFTYHHTINSSNGMKSAEMAAREQSYFSSVTDSLKRIRVLTSKNAVVLIRSPLLLIFTIFSQALILAIVCFTSGTLPLNMGLGILNHEVADTTACHNVTSECNGELLSCQFLRSIPQENFNMKWFDADQEAVAAVQTGHIWGYVSFPHNYSENLVNRVMEGSKVDEMTFNNSQITIQLDQSDAQITMLIEMLLYRAFQNFLSTLMTECGIDSRQSEFPLKFQRPIFGTEDTDFREYIVAGVATGMLFQYAAFIIGLRLIGDKKSGVVCRSLITGVKKWEIMMAYLITEFPVLFTQSIVSYYIITILFGIDILGSHILVITIFLLSGYEGSTVGYLIGVLVEEEYAATVLNVAFLFPIVFMSALWWPIEGMVPWLRYVSPFTPCTLPGEAARSVISRGWEFAHPNVWPGIAIMMTYIAVFVVLICIVNRYSKTL